MPSNARDGYGRQLHWFSAGEYATPKGPPPLWLNHADRTARELPMWMLSTRQIAAAAHLPANAAYRMGRVANVVALTQNLCLTLDPLALEVYLANLDPDMRGFAVEGVGMGLFTREVAGDADGLLDRFLSGTGAQFSGLGYTGVGLGHVHVRLPFDATLLDRWAGIGRWMVLDGLGFWSSKMDWQRHGLQFQLHPGVDEVHRRIFDRGLGRSGWFENGTVVTRVADWVRSFPEDRRRDIALGIGVAATFTGGVEEEELRALRQLLPEHAMDLAAGSLNAAETRFAAGIDTAYTERATRVLAGMSVVDAHDAAKEARRSLSADGYSDLLHWYDALRAVA
ncbi:MAG TPA: DUF1702 family protein [Allosphingosinicella sp.]|nr:DUF1702 family protein [Allosphingosinicella sp.]